MTTLFDDSHGLTPRLTYLALFFMVLSVVLVYAPHLDNGFVFDDHPQIAENPYVTAEEPWSRAFTQDVWAHKAAEIGPGYKYYRPLFSVVLRLAYLVGAGAPWAFHGLSLLLHVVAAFLVAWALRRLDTPPSHALAATAFFALSPLAGETVYWVSCLGEQLMLIGMLATLLCLLAANREDCRHRCFLLVGAALCLLLTLLSKETAVVIPPILTLEVLRHRREGWGARFGRLAPLWLLTAGFLWIRAGILGSSGLGTLLPDIVQALSRFGLALLWYGRQLVFPYPLTPFHEFPPAPGSVPELAGLLVIPVLAVAVVLLLRFRPGWLFWAGWLILPLALPLIQLFFSQKLASGVVVAERYLYMSLVPWSVLAIGLGAKLLKSALPRQFAGPAQAGLFALVVISGAVLCHSYGNAFRDDAAYFQRAYRYNPDNAFILLWRAKLLVQDGQYREALPLLERGLAIEPRLAALHVNRGIVLAKLGRHQAAIASLRAALALDAAMAGAHLALGDILRELGRIDEAGIHYRQELEVNPRNTAALLNLGTYRYLKGDPAGAAGYWERALAINPRHPDVLFNLGMVCRALGEKLQSTAFLRRFLAVADASYAEQRKQAEAWLRE